MQDTLNPLTAIEAVADYHEWECSLLSETEIAIIIPAGNISYEIHFIWQQEMQHLYLVCFTDLEVEDSHSLDFLHLLMLTNQKLWIGSFGVLENNMLAYRHMLHLKEWGYNDFESLIDEAVSIAIEESESFFPGFEKVLLSETMSTEDLNLLSLGVEGSA